METGPTSPADTPAWVDEFIAKLEPLIDKHGFAGLMIQGDTPEDSFTYSVGLTDQQWPEMVVMMNNPQIALTILNSTIYKLLGSERRPVDGMVVTEALTVPVRLRELSSTAVLGHFKGALRRANNQGKPNEAVSGFQILWPDADGRFPDEDGYDYERFPQPLLDRKI